MSSNMNFSIRPAAREDAETILFFIHAIADYEKLSNEVVNTAEMIREKLFGRDRVAEAILGFEGDTPVGFAVFFHNYSTFTGKPGLYLEDLFVLEEHRGKGYGKKLLLYLARLAKERDCGRFEWVVLDWNTPAIEFYNSLGAKQMNEWIITRVDGEQLDRLAGMG